MSKLHELFSFWLRVTAGKDDFKKRLGTSSVNVRVRVYMRVGRICGLLVCTRVSSDNRIVAHNVQINLISETRDNHITANGFTNSAFRTVGKLNCKNQQQKTLQMLKLHMNH